MNIIRALAVAAALGAASFAFSVPAAAEDDACAGQTWPNYSEACVIQMVKKACEAGGGTNCTGGADTASVGRTPANQFKAVVEVPVYLPTKN